MNPYTKGFLLHTLLALVELSELAALAHDRDGALSPPQTRAFVASAMDVTSISEQPADAELWGDVVLDRLLTLSTDAAPNRVGGYVRYPPRPSDANDELRAGGPFSASNSPRSDTVAAAAVDSYFVEIPKKATSYALENPFRPDTSGTKGTSKTNTDRSTPANKGPCPLPIEKGLDTTVLTKGNPINQITIQHEVIYDPSCPDAGSVFNVQSAGELTKTIGCDTNSSRYPACKLLDDKYTLEFQVLSFGIFENLACIIRTALDPSDTNRQDDCSCIQVNLQTGKASECDHNNFLIFYDGFETGNAEAWPTVVP